MHGDYGTSRYNHVMTPNTNSCSQFPGGGMTAIPINEDGGAHTASSKHPGGINFATVDGGTHFVADSVDRTVWSASAGATARILSVTIKVTHEIPQLPDTSTVA